MDEWKLSTKNRFEADEINSGLPVSPWSGHRNFVYDLMRFCKPETVVELGTHYGCSLFTFLQSCKDFHLDSKIYAIDTWEGDEQAGFYDETVWNTVNQTINLKFKEQNVTLIRKYFEDARSEFQDESIDLLHIDGLHTYEAVSRDYYSWLPKLKKNGIVLFHDIASELNYGTNVFWEELKKKYSHHYTFEHSWGLGVLFPKGEYYFRGLQDNNMEDKMKIYQFHYLYTLASIQLHDHVKMIQDRDQTLQSMETMIRERDHAIESMETMIRERDHAIESMDKMIKDRDLVIKSEEDLIKQKDAAFKATEKMVEVRDITLSATEQLVREREQALSATEQLVREREQALSATEQLVREREQALSAMEQLVKDRDNVIAATEALVNERDQQISNLDEGNRELREHLESEKNEIVNCNASLMKKQEEIEQKNNYIDYLLKRNLLKRIRNCK